MRADLRQDDEKLLAPEAADLVHRAHVLAQQRGELAQHAVAHRMTEGVVDVLEMVDVDQHHRERRAVAVGPGLLVGEERLGARAVPQPGQAVEAGAQFQAVLLQEHAFVRLLQQEGAEQPEGERGENPDQVQALRPRGERVFEGDQENRRQRDQCRGHRALQGQARDGERPHQVQVDFRRVEREA